MYVCVSSHENRWRSGIWFGYDGEGEAATERLTV